MYQPNLVYKDHTVGEEKKTNPNQKQRLFTEFSIAATFSCIWQRLTGKGGEWESIVVKNKSLQECATTGRYWPEKLGVGWLEMRHLM